MILLRRRFLECAIAVKFRSWESRIYEHRKGGGAGNRRRSEQRLKSYCSSLWITRWTRAQKCRCRRLESTNHHSRMLSEKRLEFFSCGILWSIVVRTNLICFLYSGTGTYKFWSYPLLKLMSFEISWESRWTPRFPIVLNWQSFASLRWTKNDRLKASGNDIAACFFWCSLLFRGVTKTLLGYILSKKFAFKVVRPKALPLTPKLFYAVEACCWESPAWNLVAETEASRTSN